MGITPEHTCIAVTYSEQENYVKAMISYPSNSGKRDLSRLR